MTSDQLNLYISKHAKAKFCVVPFIYGFNEQGDSTFTIYDTYIRSFRSAKTTKKTEGFTSYMTGLKFDWLHKFPNFSLVAFMRVGAEFLPCCEMGVTSKVQKPQ